MAVGVELIRQLNPVIRGWANHHRHVVATRVFARVDHVIFRLLWAWARRGHGKRPDRGRVLAAIRSELDKAEHRDGPGR